MMKRCPNCGWKNAEDKKNCEKCSSFLSPEKQHIDAGDSRSNSGGSIVPPPESHTAASTIKGEISDKTAWDDQVHAGQNAGARNTNYKKDESNSEKAMIVCECGYSNVFDVKFCVSCSRALSPSDRKAEAPPPFEEKQHFSGGQGMQTINPWIDKKRTTFKLSIVPRAGENIASQHAFSGNSVNLNRANLEADNPTITSNVQAVVEFKNGEWYLSNHSAMKTTFIRVDEPLKLKDGDILLLGDRLFKFNC
jgi:hypothetical protein